MESKKVSVQFESFRTNFISLPTSMVSMLNGADIVSSLLY